MIKIERGDRATGKEAIYIDPKTGEVHISEASFHSIKHKREDFIKAGNLLRTQELFMDCSTRTKPLPYLLSKVLYKYKIDTGNYTPFAEVWYDKLDEKYWVLRYSDRMVVEAGLLECELCGEPDVDIKYHINPCQTCGGCVVDCGSCMYDGYNKDICKRCTNGSLYVPSSIS